LSKAGKMMFLFTAFFLACVLLAVSFIVLGTSVFAIDSKDLDIIFFLIFVVGAVSAFGMGALHLDETGRSGAIVLAILIALIVFVGFFVVIFLAGKLAAEEVIERKVIEKPITEKLVTERTKVLQIGEDFIIIFGVSLMIAAAIAYFYVESINFKF